MKVLLFAVLFFLPCLAAAQEFDTVRICTYNLTRFGVEDVSRSKAFRTVLNEIRPGVLCVQNLHGENAVTLFRDSVLAKLDRPLVSIRNLRGLSREGYHTWIFYDSAQIYQRESLGMITSYAFTVFHNRANIETFLVWSPEFTPGVGAKAEERRVADVQSLRTGMEGVRFSYVIKEPIVIAGSLGLTGSDEAAYKAIVADTARIRFFDPLDRPGVWHNNAEFADLHTWNTKGSRTGDTAQFGMRGRHDNILTESNLLERIVPGSYTTFGNDGAHFRDSINAGTNAAVSPAVAQALHDAGDYLPVYLDFLFEVDTSGIEEKEEGSGKSSKMDLTLLGPEE